LTNLSILDKIKSGDAEAFEMVFNEHYQPLCFYALKILGDKDDAEEVVQNMFVNFWNKREQVSITGSLKSYLYQSVHNASLNVIKHEKVKRDYEDYKTYVSDLEDVSDTMESGELNKRIEYLVMAMPPERKKIFLLSRVDGLRHKEIADKLGISVKTVENQIGRALKFLRTELAEFMAIGILILNELIKWM